EKLNEDVDKVLAQNTNLREDLRAAFRTVDDLESRVAGATAERDRMRGERDEAVQKLVQATPESERYGSAQRRRAQENGNAPNTGRARPAPTREDPAEMGHWALQKNQQRLLSERAQQLSEAQQRDAEALKAAFYDEKSSVVEQEWQAYLEQNPEHHHASAESQAQMEHHFGQWWVKGGRELYQSEKRAQVTEKARMAEAEKPVEESEDEVPVIELVEEEV
ncbi:hypothetical protein ACWCPQ_33570, partial [Nocardia sp. NPDC001965]